MVFNGDSGGLDICTLADKMLGDSDDTEFPLAEKALYANMTMRVIFRAIYEVYGGWVFQDSNVSGVDSVATNLLADGTQFYAFPTAQWINGVEYMDEDGNKFPLTPITLEEIRERGYAEDEFFDTPSTPEYYRPVKNGIKIYPAWDTNKAEVTNGLIVKIGAQDISSFTAASTSTQPGYDSLAGHEAVAAGMAMFFADYNELSAFSKRKLAFEEALQGIKNHYKKKFREIKPAIRKGVGGGGYANQML
jgi:hypothetical protein